MISRYTIKRKGKDEGERPFWISFSDLMTALMSLFLVVMSVTLLSVTKKIDQEEQRKVQRESEISNLMSEIRANSKKWPQVKIDESTYRIDLGEVIRFESGRSSINQKGNRFLREYVPVLLDVYETTLGKRWIRRIVVEGFTDQDGSYLYNLKLSLDRSRMVVCALYEDTVETIETETVQTKTQDLSKLQGLGDLKALEKLLGAPSKKSKKIKKVTRKKSSLSVKDKELIRKLFLVGGYSFNSMKASKEESRRVELKLEFWALDETQPTAPDLTGKDFGSCL